MHNKPNHTILLFIILANSVWYCSKLIRYTPNTDTHTHTFTVSAINDRCTLTMPCWPTVCLGRTIELGHLWAIREFRISNEWPNGRMSECLEILRSTFVYISSNEWWWWWCSWVSVIVWDRSTTSDVDCCLAGMYSQLRWDSDSSCSSVLSIFFEYS